MSFSSFVILPPLFAVWFHPDHDKGFALQCDGAESRRHDSLTPFYFRAREGGHFGVTSQAPVWATGGHWKGTKAAALRATLTHVAPAAPTATNVAARYRGRSQSQNTPGGGAAGATATDM